MSNEGIVDITATKRFGSLVVVALAHGASSKSRTRTTCSPYDPGGNLYLVHLSYLSSSSTLFTIRLLDLNPIYYHLDPVITRDAFF